MLRGCKSLRIVETNDVDEQESGPNIRAFRADDRNDQRRLNRLRTYCGESFYDEEILVYGLTKRGAPPRGEEGEVDTKMPGRAVVQPDEEESVAGVKGSAAEMKDGNDDEEEEEEEVEKRPGSPAEGFYGPHNFGRFGDWDGHTGCF